MTRESRKVNLGDGGERWVVIIRDEPGDMELRRTAFLRELIDGYAAGLLDCGPTRFQKFRMYHEGGCWVVVLEAEVLGG